MLLNNLDLIIVGAFFLLYLIIGLALSRNVKSSDDYFLSSRKMPWWVLGISMVATTFSADTPNLVTDIVRSSGVYGNWVWWVMLLTGMLTVFFFAKLWRAADIKTDLEFYELRYSGKLAGLLRGFRAIYLGFIINIFIMATVSLAAIKIAGILFGIKPITTLIFAGGITLIYSGIGGLRSVLITDLLQFVLSLAGAIFAAYYSVKHASIQNLETLLNTESVATKISMLPPMDSPSLWLSLIVIPFGIQWWSTWYPGAEPGGGGYIAQRMLSAKNENDSFKAVLFFNVAHYALRPWPWIIVALCSLIVFPELSDIQKAFPNFDKSKIGHDIAYPAMLSFLPHGIMGLVLSSLIAAFMSTISTHLNWGSSYITLDFYKRFLDKDASEKKLIMVGRISTAVLMLFTGIIALYLQSALQAFKVLLLLGAGSGLIYILRWYWKSIHPGSEIAAMLVSFVVALYLEYIHPLIFDWAFSDSLKLIMTVSITSISWLLVSVIYGANKEGDWKKFLEKLNLGEKELKTQIRTRILMVLAACISVYSFLFLTGYLIFANWIYAGISIMVFLINIFFLYILNNRLMSSK